MAGSKSIVKTKRVSFDEVTRVVKRGRELVSCGHSLTPLPINIKYEATEFTNSAFWTPLTFWGRSNGCVGVTECLCHNPAHDD